MRIYSFLVFIIVLLAAPACSSSSILPVAPTTTLSPDLGRVFGILQIRSGNPEPVVGVNLYLGKVLNDITGKETMVGFDRVNSPRAITDNTGHFIFHNLTPGRYGLFLDIIAESYLLGNPDSGEPILVTAVGGKDIDLGILLYDSLPLSAKPRTSPYP